MSAPRKKWATQLGDPTAAMKRHTSERKAFDHIRAVAAHLGKAGAGLNVDVYVDEGRGRGWELFERMNLGDAAAMYEQED